MSFVKIGESFANYKIIKALGEGGMGEVFLAEDSHLGRKVAIKVLRIQAGQNQEVMVKRFQNEARLLASLNHPNIVAIHNFGVERDFNYIVMEFIDGVPLSEAIRKKMIGAGESLKIIRSVVEAVGGAHAKGILHRDIKPSNIIIDKDKNIKIVDFGISKSLMSEDGNLTKTDCFIGTVNYTAPEILLGFQPAASADIFSIGIVFYEMLVGENPYSSSNQFETIEKIKTKVLKLPEDLCQLLPLPLVKLFGRMTCRDRDQRFQSAADVIQEIDKIDPKLVPDILFESMGPNLSIANEKIMRESLKTKGFQSSEIEIILTLAAKKEVKNVDLVADRTEEVDTGEDATAVVPTGDSELSAEYPSLVSTSEVTISSNSLNFAIQRYTETKTLHTQRTQQFLKQQSQVSALRQTQGAPTSSWPVTLILCLGLLGGGYWMLTEKNDQVFKMVETVRLMLETQISGGEVSKVSERSPAAIPSSEPNLPPVGSRFQYDIRVYKEDDGQIFVKDIRSIDYVGVDSQGAQVRFEDKVSGPRGTMKLSPYSILPPLNYENSRGKKERIQTKNGFQKLYPLQSGKRARLSYTKVSENGSFGQVDQICRVSGNEELVAAGRRFQTWVVQCKGNDQGSTTLYYSPEIASFVRRDTRYRSAKGMVVRSWQLKSVKIP
ncbi:MAG: serine/threonine-protein kinase [Pseudomonadota bacterium]